MQHDQEKKIYYNKAKQFVNLLESSTTRSVRLKTSLYDQVALIAKSKNLSISDYINHAVAMRVFDDMEVSIDD